MTDDGPRRRRTRDIGVLLGDDCVRLEERAPSRDDAIRLVGSLLVRASAVDGSYVDAMLERERSVSTFVGEQIAMPHATLAAKGSVHRDAIALVRFVEPVDWDGEAVRIAVGIAAIGRGHIGILSRLASILLEPTAVGALLAASTDSDVRAVLAPGDRAR